MVVRQVIVLDRWSLEQVRLYIYSVTSLLSSLLSP